MEKTNILIEFCFLGDEFNPEEVTQKLLLQPTECYIKGSRSVRNFERKESCWSISTGYIETLYISDLFEKLLDKLTEVQEIIVKMKEDLNLICKFFIVVNIVENEKPAIYLDKKIIEFANYVGAEFDFDLYIF